MLILVLEDYPCRNISTGAQVPFSASISRDKKVVANLADLESRKALLISARRNIPKLMVEMLKLLAIGYSVGTQVE